MSVPELIDSPHTDLFLALAGMGNVECGLHPLKCVHLHAKSFFNAQRHVPGKGSLTVEQAGQGRPGNPQCPEGEPPRGEVLELPVHERFSRGRAVVAALS